MMRLRMSLKGYGARIAATITIQMMSPATTLILPAAKDRQILTRW
jgi:hypothetical protein